MMALRLLARKIGKSGAVCSMQKQGHSNEVQLMRKQSRNFWAFCFIGLVLAGMVVATMDGTTVKSLSTGRSTVETTDSLVRSHARALGGGSTTLLVSNSCKNLPEGTEKNVMLIVPYLLIILVCFIGLAIVCEIFFEPSLQMISRRLGLSDDVAGATFMAAGSSAPELFTSIMGTLQGSDIGIGTIVGSAMFNLLIIVGMSAAVTKGRVKIDWKPVARDITFYLLSIVLLALVVINQGEQCIELDSKNLIKNGSVIDLKNWKEGKSDAPEGFTDPMKVKCGMGVVHWHEGLVMVIAYGSYILFMVFNQRILGNCSKATSTKVFDASTQCSNKVDESVGIKEEEETRDEEDPWYAIPEGKLSKVYWLFTFPLSMALHSTIPNCEKGFFKGCMIASFSMCIVWIALLCLVMVELGEEIGCLLHVDPIIMGVVLLAGGTSVPDLMASMIVARQGQGDMAIANAVGSNVFDILFGLGLPWMFVPWILGSDIQVSIDGIAIDVVILVGTVVLYVGVLIANRWAMNSVISVIFCVLYACYIGVALIREYAK